MTVVAGDRSALRWHGGGMTSAEDFAATIIPGCTLSPRAPDSVVEHAAVCLCAAAARRGQQVTHADAVAYFEACRDEARQAR